MEENKKEEKNLPAEANKKEDSFANGIINYALSEYIVPKAVDVGHDMLFDVMDIIGDAAKGVLDRIFYPNEDSIPRRRSDNRSSNVNVRRIQDGYRDYRNGRRHESDRDHRYNDSRDRAFKRPSNEAPNDLYFDSSKEANEVAGYIIEQIDNYDKCKVSDLYEHLRKKVSITDFDYGWTSVNDVRTEHRSGYYWVVLTRPIRL